MSEAVTDVRKPSIDYYAWTKSATGLAAITWVIAGIITAIDVARDFPTVITIALLILASVVTVVATQMRLTYRSQTDTAADHETILIEVGRLARQVEQLTAKLTDNEAAFDTGRRYEATGSPGPTRPRAVS